MVIAKKKMNHLLVALAICVSLLSFGGVDTQASGACVIKSYIADYNIKWGTTYKHSYTYMDLAFANGFTYTESSKVVTTFSMALLGYVQREYTRTYRTY